MNFIRCRLLWPLLLISSLLAGCGGGGGSGTTSSVNSTGSTPGSTSGASNHAPVIYGTPGSVALIGSLYTFSPIASDADGNTLTFSITNRPSWATFSTSTGKLSGTPTSASVGTTNGIVISVNDGLASASLPAFSLTVNALTPTPANHPPVVSNIPSTSVNAGSSYSYTPSATDTDGDTLTFSITNRPSWATFSTSTGKLSGTPTSANAGITTGVVISVSDGKTTTVVGPFSITVIVINNGTAALSWVAPTTRQDGSPFSLSQLMGYNVYEGTAATNLSRTASITNPTATSYTISNLSPGAHYFSVTAYDITGAESSYSSVVSKTIK